MVSGSLAVCVFLGGMVVEVVVGGVAILCWCGGLGFDWRMGYAARERGARGLRGLAERFLSGVAGLLPLRGAGT